MTVTEEPALSVPKGSPSGTPKQPNRIFLDTNVYIIGAADPASPEGQILQWAEWESDTPGPVEVVISDELLDQVGRVGRRVRGKDWGSQLINAIWSLRFGYVALDASDIQAVADSGLVPSEDAGVYLTAQRGQAQCFVSTNRDLIRAVAEKTGEFECLSPAGFAQKYLRSADEAE